MRRHGKPWSWFAVAALLATPVPAEAQQLGTINDMVARLHQCWKPPPRTQANPVDVTLIVSFNREGAILGRPRVTFETAGATENDRLAYRVAAMEALQRCTPMPFSEGLGGAVAGRPFAVRFWTRKTSPKPERRAWLIPKTL